MIIYVLLLNIVREWALLHVIIVKPFSSQLAASCATLVSAICAISGAVGLSSGTAGKRAGSATGWRLNAAAAQSKAETVTVDTDGGVLLKQILANEVGEAANRKGNVALLGTVRLYVKKLDAAAAFF